VAEESVQAVDFRAGQNFGQAQPEPSPDCRLLVSGEPYSLTAKVAEDSELAFVAPNAGAGVPPEQSFSLFSGDANA
jgi:hypothetical protein